MAGTGSRTQTLSGVQTNNTVGIRYLVKVQVKRSHYSSKLVITFSRRQEENCDLLIFCFAEYISLLLRYNIDKFGNSLLLDFIDFIEASPEMVRSLFAISAVKSCM